MAVSVAVVCDIADKKNITKHKSNLDHRNGPVISKDHKIN